MASFPYVHKSTRPSTDSLLEALVETYGASNHEDRVLDRVQRTPATLDEGRIGRQQESHSPSRQRPPGNASPSIVVIAHTDEIGLLSSRFQSDGRLEVETLGGDGSQLLRRASGIGSSTANSDQPGIMELPPSWMGRAEFQMANRIGGQTIRVDVGARNSRNDVAKLGIRAGADWVTIPKRNTVRFLARARMAAALTTAWAIRRSSPRFGQ